MTRFWEPEAIAYLETLVTRCDRSRIVSVFNRTARERGWKLRSGPAIKRKLWGMGYLSIDGPFYPQQQLAKILGIGLQRVYRWSRLQMIPTRRANKKNGVRVYARLQDIRAFILDNPHELAGVKKSGLLYFLEDEKVVDALLEKIPQTNERRRIKRVICNSKGERYASQSEAAAHTLYSLSGFRAMIDRGGIDYAGVQWWRVDDEKRA